STPRPGHWPGAVGARVRVSPGGAARQPTRDKSHVIGAGPASAFYIYNSHYKAGTASTDLSQRQVEATAIRADADALGQGASILYVGDYNCQSSSEGVFPTPVSAGSGHALDPVNQPCTRHNNGRILTLPT